MEGKNYSKGRDKIRLGNKKTVAAWKLCNCNHSGRVKSKLSRKTIDGKAMKFAR